MQKKYENINRNSYLISFLMKGSLRFSWRLCPVIFIIFLLSDRAQSHSSPEDGHSIKQLLIIALQPKPPGPRESRGPTGTCNLDILQKHVTHQHPPFTAPPPSPDPRPPGHTLGASMRERDGLTYPLRCPPAMCFGHAGPSPTPRTHHCRVRAGLDPYLDPNLRCGLQNCHFLGKYKHRKIYSSALRSER